MKIIKRILVLLLVMISLCPQVTNAAPQDDYDYSYLNNGSIIITKYKGSAAEISIPSHIYGTSIIAIGQSAFKNKKTLTHVVLPDTIQYIGNYAFEGCTLLQTINFPSSLKTIGDCAFQECVSLSEALLPEGLSELGQNAFYKCSGLKFINIPSTLPYLNRSVFCDCPSITSVVIPDGVKEIASYAFEGGTKLQCVYIPSSITYIGERAFPYSPNVTVVAPAGSYGQQYSQWHDMSYAPPIRLASLLEIARQAAMKIDYEYESYGEGIMITKYIGFESIVNIPEQIEGHPVTHIGKNAFEACRSIQHVTIPDTVIDIGEMAFYDCRLLESVTVSKNLDYIGSLAFAWCWRLKEIELPDTLTSIASNPFWRCSSLSKIDISPDHPYFAVIDGALYRKKTRSLICYSDGTGLRSLTIPEGIESIEMSAFVDCVLLENVVLPNSLTSIGSAAFSGCNRIKNINIPSNVNNIGKDIFYGCSPNLNVTVSPGSIAEQYCKENNIHYVY